MPALLSGRYREPGSLPVASTTPQNLFTILGRTHRISAYETFTQICPDSLCRESAVVESAPSLVTDTWVLSLRTLLADGLADRLVPEIDGAWAGFGSSTEVDLRVQGEASTGRELRANRVRGDDRDQFAAFLKGLKYSTGTAVHYLHLAKPHEPLMFLPDGRRYDYCACSKVNDDGTWPEQPTMASQRLQRYLLQATYVDTLLGRVRDTMEGDRPG